MARNPGYGRIMPKKKVLFWTLPSVLCFMSLVGWWYCHGLLAYFYFGIIKGTLMALGLDYETYDALIYSSFFLLPAGIFILWIWLLLYPFYKLWKMKRRLE
jgi:hypothetical protein